MAATLPAPNSGAEEGGAGPGAARGSERAGALQPIPGDPRGAGPRGGGYWRGVGGSGIRGGVRSSAAPAEPAAPSAAAWGQKPAAREAREVPACCLLAAEL